MLNQNEEGAKVRIAKKMASPAVGFGSSFAGGMAVFALGGHWLDKKTGHESLFTLLGVGLGFLYGAWELWKLITISNQQAEKKKRNQIESTEAQNNDPPE